MIYTFGTSKLYFIHILDLSEFSIQILEIQNNFQHFIILEQTKLYAVQHTNNIFISDGKREWVRFVL